jgi:phenylacetate-CoA ligase
MNSVVVRNFTFPLHQHLTHRSTLRALKRLRQSQRWHPEQLQQWQEQRLKHMLTHAQHNVPYYRNLLESNGLNRGSAYQKAAWGRIPLLTKDIVRQHFKDLLAIDRPRLFITGQTSGSTGQPVTWRVDRDAESVQLAAHLRSREWWGLKPSDPNVMLWGRDALQDIRGKLRDLLVWNKRSLPAMELSRDLAASYYRKIRRYRPRYLRGYPSMLVRFADLCEARGLCLRTLSLKAIITTAEVLTTAQRLRIQAAYGCPVANEYGCSEVQCIAFECPEGSMHIQADVLLVEFIRDGKAVSGDEFGEMVVTDLTNEVMPVIRYRTGDFGRPRAGRCSCGRTLPLMELTLGRQAEFFRLPDSRMVHTEVFTPVHNTALFRLVDQFRIIQEAPERFRVQVVLPETHAFSSVEHEFTRLITCQLGDEIEVRVERVADIPPQASGKKPYFISRISCPNEIH